MDTRLYRSRDDRIIAGVAGGLADYLGLDPSLVRIAWAVLILAGGVGLLLYIIMWIVVPEEDDLSPQQYAAATGQAAAAEVTGSSTAPTGAPVDWRSQRVNEREARRAARRARRAANPDEGRTIGLLVGGFLVLIGIAFLLRNFIPTIDFDLFWPVILVIVGIVILVAAFRPSGPAGPGGGAPQ
jgi:phage shock protein PspC (stress-responsive transcriptional regulator)